MSLTYQLAISPAQTEAYLSRGLDHVCGFAVDAAAAASITRVADLIELLNCGMPGSPFSADRPIDILHVPNNPFIQTRLAVGPLHTEAFLGGVVEFAPFDGSGIAKAGDVETPLLWMEPTRLTAGSRLWRFHPDSAEPELLGIYHGIAWGWESTATGDFTACIPSQVLGPVTHRNWAELPAEIELDDAGETPAAVTLVSPTEPTQEEGFTQLPNGLWAKRIAYHDDLDLHENQLLGRVQGIPVRAIRALRDGDDVVLQVASLLIDSPLAAAAGFQRYTQGINTLVLPVAKLEDQTTRQARPKQWDVSKRPAVTNQSQRERTNDDIQALLTDIFALISYTAPTGWQALRLTVQMVEKRVHYSARAELAPAPAQAGTAEGDAHRTDDGADRSGAAQTAPPSARTVPVRLLPTAIMNYAGQIKALAYREGEGAPFSLTFEFTSQGRSKLSLNKTKEPAWAAQVPAETWRADFAAFPRDEEHTPHWLRARMADDTTPPL